MLTFIPIVTIITFAHTCFGITLAMPTTFIPFTRVGRVLAKNAGVTVYAIT